LRETIVPGNWQIAEDNTGTASLAVCEKCRLSRKQWKKNIATPQKCVCDTLKPVLGIWIWSRLDPDHFSKIRNYCMAVHVANLSFTSMDVLFYAPCLEMADF
jgi:hypothetical protein